MTPVIALLLALSPAATEPPRSLDRATWVTRDDYPPEALRLRIQGTVAFLLDVDAAGLVTGCAVTRSSGYALLDAATCRLLQTRGRYAPRAGEHGMARPFQIRSVMAWRLPTVDEGRDRQVRIEGAAGGDAATAAAGAPTCIADDDGTPRRLPAPTCAQIVAAARAQHEPLERPVTVWLPDAFATGG